VPRSGCCSQLRCAPYSTVATTIDVCMCTYTASVHQTYGPVSQEAIPPANSLASTPYTLTCFTFPGLVHSMIDTHDPVVAAQTHVVRAVCWSSAVNSLTLACPHRTRGAQCTYTLHVPSPCVNVTYLVLRTRVLAPSVSDDKPVAAAGSTSSAAAVKLLYACHEVVVIAY
jgi:hypothetical protein